MFNTGCTTYHREREGVPSGKETYGDQEVCQLLIDRPELSFYVKKGNPIWTWMVGAFNKPNNGYKIVWDSSETSSFNPYGGEYTVSFHPDECRIKVDETYKDGQFAGLKRQAEEMLFTTVFELCNARGSEATVQRAAEAYAGMLPRDQFIVETAHQEYMAEMDVKDFKIYVLDPFCNTYHIDHNDAVWPKIPSDFKEWLHMFAPDSYYPWKLYGNQYDSLYGHSKHDLNGTPK